MVFLDIFFPLSSLTGAPSLVFLLLVPSSAETDSKESGLNARLE